MTVINCDCRDGLSWLDDNSVDAIITDPPYELGFMGKSWDASGIAYNVDMWRECLRVLKPGGHMLVFGAPRTYHRVAVAVEDAGFGIRDCLLWLFGSGFPKNHNVSLAIDKELGAVRPVVGSKPQSGAKFKLTQELIDNGGFNDPERTSYDVTAPGSKEAQRWEGWGTALKPAYEPILLARKPLDGTVASNVMKYGTGALNIDACRVGDEVMINRPAKNTPRRAMNGYWRNDDYPSVATGRWPANVTHDGSDEVLEGFPEVSGVVGAKKVEGGFRFITNGDLETVAKYTPGVPDNGSAARFFYCSKASKKDRDEGLEDFDTRSAGEMAGGRAEGSAGLGTAYAGTRTPGKNSHPTVKPTKLLRYLARLITPPQGLILDPFSGSGSTGKAAVLEGFQFAGFELSEEYTEIANARIEHARRSERTDRPS